MTRIFQQTILQEHSLLKLDESATHHLARVLRAKIGDNISLFNGSGDEYECVITQIDKKAVTVEIKKRKETNRESSLELILAQGISRGEKMDFTIQKAVEMGVKKIVPLFTERCNVKLDDDRKEKRIQHWRSIVIGACEQSGRNYVPEIDAPQSLKTWCRQIKADWKFVLSPHAGKKLSDFSISKQARVVLLIGPEGGLSDEEISETLSCGFTSLQVGPRVLRTETAGLAALTMLQFYAGDLS